jgi:hypothetical protein
MSIPTSSGAACALSPDALVEVLSDHLSAKFLRDTPPGPPDCPDLASFSLSTEELVAAIGLKT